MQEQEEAGAASFAAGRREDAERRRAVEEAIHFDRLVGDLAAGFVNVPTGQLDAAIRDAQRRILEALDFDRSALFQRSGGESDFVLTHYWAGPDVPPASLSGLKASEFPWSLGRILEGQSAVFSSPDEIPDARERERVSRFGTVSRVAFPLSIDGQIVGIISFASGRKPRQWTPHLLSRLQLVANVIGGALARCRVEEALVAGERRFRTLADEAPVMIWTSGADGGCTWFNRQWLEFVGHPLEHELGTGWLANVHPEDRDACMETYERSFKAREPFSMEYRLRRSDGEWRWVLDKGRPAIGPEGGFAGYLGSATDVTEQKRAAQIVEESRNQLHAENVYLRREVKVLLGTSTEFVGKSAAIRRVLDLVEHVAATDSTVLLLGETGTGKELLATQIHERSARRGRPMVRVNAAAIPAPLIESELFGRERGAFTGAVARQIGRFELADQSTIFLDEIGDLPAEIQVKLLRVIEERQIERLGNPRPIPVNTRIIAATHRNLEQQVGDGHFREDLFYRLNVFPIHVPPLRERIEDIPLLVWRFVEELATQYRKRIDAIARDSMEALQRYPWPGNIRELRNVVERAMILGTERELTIAVPDSGASAAGVSSRLEDVEREHIRRVLDASAWKIRGKDAAADRLGLPPTTLETRMAKLGITRPKHGG